MIKAFILFCLLIKIAACTDSPLQEFSKGNEKFTAELVKIVAKNRTDRGLVSPISAEIILALTAEGAVGETYEELRRALSLPDKQRTKTAVKTLVPLLNKSSENFNISLANKMYVNNNFRVKESFQEVAVSDYGSEVANVNFAQNQKAADTINHWVESKTNNKIQKLVSPEQLNANTALVLVNTLYLRGKWQIPFVKERTKQLPFYNGSKVQQVETMHSADSATYLYFHCGYLKAKFLEIGYRDSTVSMTIILPDARDGLTDLENNLEEYLKPHNLTRQRVAVRLPKFSTADTHDYVPVLQNLGVSRLFDARQSNLSGISDTENLYVSFVQQKTFINVTESGTEAAAATAVGVSRLVSELPPELTFNADHPFFYFIRESKSSTILFAGNFKA